MRATSIPWATVAFTVGYLASPSPRTAADAQVVLIELCEPTTEAGFDYEHSPEEGMVIYWTTPTDSISLQVTNEAVGWLAVGFSEDETMIASDAVVFRPDSDRVAEYSMTAKSTEGVTPSSTTDISATTFSQENNLTTFSFERNTVPGFAQSGKLIIPDEAGTETNIVWAFGSDNTFAHHVKSGVFSVDLTCPSTSSDNGLETTVPSPPSAERSAAPTPAEGSAAPASTEGLPIPTPAPSNESASSPAPVASDAPVGTDDETGGLTGAGSDASGAPSTGEGACGMAAASAALAASFGFLWGQELL